MAGETQLPGQSESSYWHRIDYTRYAPPLNEFDEPVGQGSVGLNHYRYKVVKTTAKGVWLDVGGFNLDKESRKFVLFDSKRQWASPTFEQAKEKFVRRKQKQIAILQREIDDIRRALEAVETFKPHDENHSVQGWIG